MTGKDKATLRCEYDELQLIFSSGEAIDRQAVKQRLDELQLILESAPYRPSSRRREFVHDPEGDDWPTGCYRISGCPTMEQQERHMS